MRRRQVDLHAVRNALQGESIETGQGKGGKVDSILIIFKLENDILTISGLVYECISARPPCQPVVAGAAIQRVIADTAVQPVITRATFKQVITTTGSAVQHIITRAATECVVSQITSQYVISGGTGDIFDIREFYLPCCAVLIGIGNHHYLIKRVVCRIVLPYRRRMKPRYHPR